MMQNDVVAIRNNDARHDTIHNDDVRYDPIRCDDPTCYDDLTIRYNTMM
jgi:hypothetical protein